MFLKSIFILVMACTVAMGRPQGDVQPAAPASDVSGATGNSDTPSVLNPDAPADGPATEASATPNSDTAVTDAATGAPTVETSHAPADGEATDQPSTAANIDSAAIDTAAADTATAATDAPAVPDSASPDVPATTGPAEWKQNAVYQTGDLVTYGGEVYSAVTQHAAYAFNWTPPQAPALWTKVAPPQR